MKALQDVARTLLVEGTVQVVIGWEEGPRGARPAFVTDPAHADRLVFDRRCTHNLAAYLSPRRSHLARLGKRAVVVKGCDARAVAGLIRETQIKREDVVIIGVRCGGVLADPASPEALTADTVAERCPGCDAREPHLADHLVGELPPEPPGRARRDERIAELEAMTAAERWAFWTGELARCVRCNACREVCPMCFCERCVADKTQPQWLESSPHPRGNLAWHLIRALHQAGRCVDCGECVRACPADIPLGLLNRKVARVVADRFDHRPSDDPAAPAPVGTFSLSDKQEFIL
jgi:formate dehydrogenase (coenzyme F420) beta subunit